MCLISWGTGIQRTPESNSPLRSAFSRPPLWMDTNKWNPGNSSCSFSSWYHHLFGFHLKVTCLSVGCLKEEYKEPRLAVGEEGVISSMGLWRNRGTPQKTMRCPFAYHLKGYPEHTHPHTHACTHARDQFQVAGSGRVTTCSQFQPFRKAYST